MLSKVFLVLLLSSVEAPSAVVIKPNCLIPLRPSVDYITALGGHLTDDIEQFRNYSLCYQAFHKPCMQVFYRGNIGKANFYLFYGTCDDEQMFRYAARYQPQYGCWRVRLNTWRTIRGQTRCMVEHPGVPIDIHAGYFRSDQEGIHIRTNHTFYDFENEQFKSGERFYNLSSQERCPCNDSKQHQLHKLWQATPCQGSTSERPAKPVLLAPKAVADAIVMFVVTAFLTVVVASVYCSVPVLEQT